MKKKVVCIVVSILIALAFVALIVGNCLLFVRLQDKQKQEAWAEFFREYYNNKVAQYEEENPTLHDVDVVFLGDSLTDGYDVNSYYAQFNVANRGIGADTTFGLERRLKVSAYDVNPKVVVMLIGANNLDTMLNNYERIVVSLKQNLPDAKIVLLSICPTSGSQAWRNPIALEKNVEVEAIAGRQGCTYVDMFPILLDPDTDELRESYTIEGLHFTPEGYEVITAALTPILTDLLA
ncbi:MAG: hypothetical protein J5815_00275 [Clostridia bacterium]|nr:hypothetical protein [Clostridia bacterium]